MIYQQFWLLLICLCRYFNSLIKTWCEEDKQLRGVRVGFLSQYNLLFFNVYTMNWNWRFLFICLIVILYNRLFLRTIFLFFLRSVIHVHAILNRYEYLKLIELELIKFSFTKKELRNSKIGKMRYITKRENKRSYFRCSQMN